MASDTESTTPSVSSASATPSLLGVLGSHKTRVIDNDGSGYTSAKFEGKVAQMEKGE